MIDHGYIRVHRSIWSHPVLQDDAPMTRAEAWIWMLGRAYFAEGRGLVRGQLEASHAQLARSWRWGNRHAVRRFLNALVADAMITCEGSVITVLNYDRYQADAVPESARSSRADSAQMARSSRADSAQADADEHCASGPGARSSRADSAQMARSSRADSAHTKKKEISHKKDPSPPTPPRSPDPPGQRRGTAGVEEGGSHPSFSTGVMADLGECRAAAATDGRPARLWVQFDGQPPVSVTEAMRAGGWTYVPDRRLWTVERTDAADELAARIFGAPVDPPSSTLAATPATTSTTIATTSSPSPTRPSAPPLSPLPGVTPPPWWESVTARLADGAPEQLAGDLSTLRLAGWRADRVRLQTPDELAALLVEKNLTGLLCRVATEAAGRDVAIDVRHVDPADATTTTEPLAAAGGMR